MTPPTRHGDTRDLVVRLRRIEGQVRGVQRMVVNGGSAADVLTQVASIRGALAGFASAVVNDEIARVAGAAPDDIARLSACVGLLAER